MGLHPIEKAQKWRDLLCTPVFGKKMSIEMDTELRMCALSCDTRKGLGNFQRPFVAVEATSQKGGCTQLVSSKYQSGCGRPGRLQRLAFLAH